MEKYWESSLGRPLWVLDMTHGKTKEKLIVVFLRVNIPEVTGFFAFKAFMEEVMGDSPTAQVFLENIEYWLSLVNPDGVDLDTGAIMLEELTRIVIGRYRQPEIKAIVNYIRKITKENARVVLGLDFHSTWYDVFYTNKERESPISKFPRSMVSGLGK